MLPRLCSILNPLYSWTTLFLNYSILDLPNFSAALSDESSILKILLKHETEVYKLNIIGSNKFLLKDQIIIVTEYFFATATVS
jgi:hypothetical protein